MDHRIFERELTISLPPLLRYARRLTQNQDRAQDLVQDTMLQALRFQTRVAACEHPERYLATMMRNLNISYHRKNARDKGNVPHEEVVLTSQDAPQHAIETCRQVVEAITLLPPEHAEILSLSAYEGLSYRELAERLDIPLGTVMSRECICDVFTEG